MKVCKECIENCADPVIKDGCKSVYNKIINRKYDLCFPRQDLKVISFLLKAKYRFNGCV
jgi:hypothetical protein